MEKKQGEQTTAETAVAPKQATLNSTQPKVQCAPDRITEERSSNSKTVSVTLEPAPLSLKRKRQ